MDQVLGGTGERIVVLLRHIVFMSASSGVLHDAPTHLLVLQDSLVLVPVFLFRVVLVLVVRGCVVRLVVSHCPRSAPSSHRHLLPGSGWLVLGGLMLLVGDLRLVLRVELVVAVVHHIPSVAAVYLRCWLARLL